MVAFVAHLLVTAALIIVVANLVSGVSVSDFGSAFVLALVLGFVNAIVKPLMVVLTLPLTVFTFGLFLLVINGLMLQLAAYFVPGVEVGGFGAAVLGSVLLTILNLLVDMVLSRVVSR
jgi:putative membrane protein